MRLTKSALVKLALPKGRIEQTFYDDDLRGFGIRLRASGKKSWVAVYRLGNTTRRVTIGDVSTVLPDEARSRAREILAKADLGHDTQAERTQERIDAEQTLELALASYLEQYVEVRQKRRTQLETKRHLLSHWKPLHNQPLAKIARRDIAVQLSDIVRRNGPIAANRARSALGGFFVWAIRQGLLESNPVAATAPPAPERARTRVLNSNEIRAIWRHSEGLGDYNAIVRLLFLTGQRRAEIGAMSWQEIDFEKALWSLPAERTKNGLAHDVPLSRQVVEILSVRHPCKARDLVFGTGRGPFSGWSKCKERLDHRMASENAVTAGRDRPESADFIPRWVIHDVRRTVVTGMAELGIQPHIIEAVVNHISGHKAGVAGIYNRAKYASEKRAALQAWADHLDAISACEELGRPEWQPTMG